MKKEDEEGLKSRLGKFKGIVLFVFAFSMVVTGSFALFTDDTQNVISGKMEDLGIETVVEGDVGKQLSVGESSNFNVTTKVNDGADVKIRQRFSAGNIEEYINNGDIKMLVNGREVALDGKGEYTTPISEVKSGASIRTDIAIVVGEMEGGIPETNVGVKVITEALQDRNTNSNSFSEINKVEF